MAKYIPLDAVLAWAKKTYLCKNASAIRKVCYKQLLEHLDTLEVKGVDLDEETLHSELRKIYTSVYDSKDIEAAKHFFKLGMQASNPLTWEDIANINDIVSEILKECKDIILYDTQESFCKEVLKRYKAQKGE